MKKYRELPFRLVPKEQEKDFQFIKDLIKNYIDCPYLHNAEITMAAQQIILQGFNRKQKPEESKDER